MNITVCNMTASLIVTARAADRITTARLPMETRQKLETLAKVLKKTKSQIIIEAVEMYYEKEDNELDSYTLGLPYFAKEGDIGSGIGDLAENHKKYFYEGLREQHRRQEEEFDKYIEELKKKKTSKRKVKAK